MTIIDTTTTEAELARAYAELAHRNACLQRQVRKGPGHPDFAAAYRSARAAYRAFWDMPGADDFARKVFSR